MDIFSYSYWYAQICVHECMHMCVSACYMCIFVHVDVNIYVCSYECTCLYIHVEDGFNVECLPQLFSALCFDAGSFPEPVCH